MKFKSQSLLSQDTITVKEISILCNTCSLLCNVLYISTSLELELSWNFYSSAYQLPV